MSSLVREVKVAETDLRLLRVVCVCVYVCMCVCVYVCMWLLGVKCLAERLTEVSWRFHGGFMEV